MKNTNYGEKNANEGNEKPYSKDCFFVYFIKELIISELLLKKVTKRLHFGYILVTKRLQNSYNLVTFCLTEFLELRNLRKLLF